MGFIEDCIPVNEQIAKLMVKYTPKEWECVRLITRTEMLMEGQIRDTTVRLLSEDGTLGLDKIPRKLAKAVEKLVVIADQYGLRWSGAEYLARLKESGKWGLEVSYDYDQG